jgi:hypothetical protein
MKLPPCINEQHRVRAFTLVEVMVALMILFMGVFAILSLVGTGLKGVRTLQFNDPDPAMVIADLLVTNKVEEGVLSGDFEELAPGCYPDYEWARDIREAGTNGLYRVDMVITRKPRNGPPVNSKMSVMLYLPQSQTKRGGLR